MANGYSLPGRDGYKNKVLMDEFFTFWNKHCSPIREQAEDYLQRHKRLRHFARDAVIKFEVDDFPYLCIVLAGVVGGYQTNRKDKRTVRELLLPLDFFTGTLHTFSSKQHPLEFVALKATKLLLIPIIYAREGQRVYTEISELFHVLKQRKILRLRKMVEIYQEEEAFERYVLLWELLPEIAAAPLLTNAIHAELLHMSVSHLKRQKRKFFDQR